MSRRIVAPFVSSLLLCFASLAQAVDTPCTNTGYRQIDLVSNIAGRAPITDAQLVNPWGLAFNPTGPLWVANNGTATSEALSATGASLLTVTVPTTGEGPTGIVFYGGSDGFRVVKDGVSAPARFIFASQDGSLSAWNPNVDANAVTVSPAGEASYTGLAFSDASGTPYLYAANFGEEAVEVYDSTFAEVDLAGDFTDPNLPDGYAPFNVQAIGSSIYVTYAVKNGEDEQPGAGLGIVDEYDAQGNFVRRVVSEGGSLNAPWGLALAPSNFGAFSGALLVGNFGDGTIDAFDVASGSMIGTVSDSTGAPLVIDGLWGIAFAPGSIAGGSGCGDGEDDDDDDDGGGAGHGQGHQGGNGGGHGKHKGWDNGHGGGNGGGHGHGGGNGGGHDGDDDDDDDGDCVSATSAQLWFAAGLNDEADGLVGYLVAACVGSGSGDDDEDNATAARVPVSVLNSPARRAAGGVNFRVDANVDPAGEMRIYDAAGRLVAVPVTAFQGTTRVTWDGVTLRGERAQAGVYFYKVRTATGTFGGRFVLLP